LLLFFHFTTVSFTALFNVPEDVVTVTYPVFAPLGIVAVRYVLDTTVNAASAPSKVNRVHIYVSCGVNEAF
jgi:hypothetical protein